MIQSVDQLTGYDLIVAADGLNSLVRRSFESGFGASVSHSPNKFAWYGTTKRFETLSQTFVATDLGSFNAHHYRYAPDMSTFLVECDRCDLAGLRLCRQDGRAVAGDLRARVRRHAGRPPTDVEQIGVAQFSLDLERALEPWQQGADRRRTAFGAFFHRLGHAARDRGRDRADQGAGSGNRYCRGAGPLSERAQADREEAGDGGAHQRRLVRKIPRPHEARPDGFCL